MMGRLSEAKRARLLREYLLGTLSLRRAARVEQELAASQEWQEALEREREALDTLGMLPSVTPPPGLAERTVAAARAEADVEREERPRWRHAWGYVAAAGVLLLAAAILLPALPRAREAAQRSSSQNNLKQLGVVFKMYAGENKGLYPPRSPYPDVAMFDLAKVYPEYMTDLSVLVNPRLPNAEKIIKRMNELAARQPRDWHAIEQLAAQSYTYPGWLVKSANDLREVDRALGTRRELASTAYDDLHVGDKTIPRLREGIERFLITDINNPAGSAAAQATLPVVFETPQPDLKLGLNVLYMDGHVEFVREGQEFPATDDVRRILQPER